VTSPVVGVGPHSDLLILNRCGGEEWPKNMFFHVLHPVSFASLEWDELASHVIVAF
jgi:hypothetical protein